MLWLAIRRRVRTKKKHIPRTSPEAKRQTAVYLIAVQAAWPLLSVRPSLPCRDKLDAGINERVLILIAMLGMPEGKDAHCFARRTEAKKSPTKGSISNNPLHPFLPLSIPLSRPSKHAYLVVKDSKWQDNYAQQGDEDIHNFPKQAHVEATATFHPSLGTPNVNAVICHIEG